MLKPQHLVTNWNQLTIHIIAARSVDFFSAWQNLWLVLWIWLASAYKVAITSEKVDLNGTHAMTRAPGTKVRQQSGECVAAWKCVAIAISTAPITELATRVATNICAVIKMAVAALACRTVVTTTAHDPISRHWRRRFVVATDAARWLQRT